MPNSPTTSGIYNAKYTRSDDANPDWKTAETLNNFSFPWLDLRAPKTVFRALWNNESLMFQFDVIDADIVLAQGDNAKEQVIGSDRVELFFSVDRNLTRYFALELDPRGTVLDYEASFHRRMNWEWSCKGLNCTASINDSGYRVDATIPLTTLRDLECLHTDDQGDYLIAGLYRAEFSHGGGGNPTIENWISWIQPDVATPDFHVPSSFGTLRLIK